MTTIGMTRMGCGSEFGRSDKRPEKLEAESTRSAQHNGTRSVPIEPCFTATTGGENVFRIQRDLVRGLRK